MKGIQLIPACDLQKGCHILEVTSSNIVVVKRIKEVRMGAASVIGSDEESIEVIIQDDEFEVRKKRIRNTDIVPVII